MKRKAINKAKPPESPPKETGWHWTLSLYLLLLITVLLVYARLRTFDFVDFDDAVYVTDNPHIRTGLTVGNIAFAFLKGYGANWIPLTSISQMLDCQLFGLDSGWHHLTNVALHALSTLLLFGLLHRMTGSVWKSLFVAFVFGLHPLHVESVAWVAERKDVLSAFFWIVSLWAYLYYSERPSRGRYALVALALSLGLLSKPTTVTLPFALLLLDVWPLKRITLSGAYRPQLLRLFREKVPLFLLSAGACVITYLAQQRAGAIQSIQTVPLGERFSNAFLSYATYLIQLVYPVKLAVFYPYPSPDPWKALLAVLVIVLISILVFRARSRPYLVAGWLWYLGTLAPMLGIVQVGAQSHADRYTYIPFIGISVMLAWGLGELAGKWERGPAVLGVAAIAFCAMWLTVTWRQVGYWKDSETLFGHALQVTTGNYVAHNNYGYALRQRGDTDEAISHFRMALQIRPDDVDAHTNLGEALAAEGRFNEAAPELLESLRLNPTYPAVHVDLGVLLDHLGRTKEAAEQYQLAVAIEPDDAVAHSGLGSMLIELGQTDAGLRELHEGIRLDPNDAAGHYNLGLELATLGRMDEALPEFAESARLRPNDPQSHYNLGNALAAKGRMNEALEEFTTTLRLDPTDANAHLNVGKVLFYLKRYSDAKAHLAEALRLDPHLQEARDSLEFLNAQKDN